MPQPSNNFPDTGLDGASAERSLIERVKEQVGLILLLAQVIAVNGTMMVARFCGGIYRPSLFE